MRDYKRSKPKGKCIGIFGLHYNMNKHRGTNFDDYLKERGISEEVSALAKQRWEVLRTETSNKKEKTTDVPDSPPSHFKRLLHRLRHHINHLFS